jgi:hypothetical protein
MRVIISENRMFGIMDSILKLSYNPETREFYSNGVIDGVIVIDGVTVGVLVGVTVIDGVTDGVGAIYPELGLTEGVGVFVGVIEGVTVIDGVTVGVIVGVGVGVGVGEANGFS